MSKLKNENGYTLAITLCIIVLFTILGLSLMMLTLNGSKKNASREGLTQAQELSVRGQDYLMSKIEHTIENEVLSGKTYEKAVEETINSYICPPATETNLTKYEFPGELGKSYYCIESNLKAGNLNTLTVKSIGTVNNGTKEVELSSKYKLEVENQLVSSPFPYAVSSSKSKDNQNGSVTIAGGVEINGDMKIAQDLFTKDVASFKTLTVDSVKPSIKNAKIKISGKYYTSSNLSSNGSSTTFDNAFFSKTNSSSTSDNDILTAPIDVKSIISKNKILKTDPGVKVKDISVFFDGSLNLIGERRTVSNVESDLPTTYLMTPHSFDHGKDVTYLFFLNNKFNRVAFYKNLELQSTLLTTTKLEVKNAYVGQNMKIGYLEDKETLVKQKINIKGNYFVEGDLTIDNTELTGNANIFVGGNVKILFSEFNNANISIIADGNIEMRYISQHMNPKAVKAKNKGYGEDDDNDDEEITGEGSVLNGLLYSNKKLEIKSASSRLTINGGIHANNIYIDSVRGRSSPPLGACNLPHDNREYVKYPQKNSEICFDSRVNQAKSEAYYFKTIFQYYRYTFPMVPRLKINYNASYLNLFTQPLATQKLKPIQKVSQDYK